jgi:hypothetical protein
VAKRPTKAQLLARARFVARFGGGKRKRKRAGKRKAAKRRHAPKRKHVAAAKKHTKRARKHEYLTHRGKLYRQVVGSVSTK